MSAGDVAVLRGNADAMALRLGCHDVSLHRRFAPENARRGRSTTRWSRPAWRRSAPGGCRAFRATSPRCWRTATTGAASTRPSPTGRRPLEDAVALMVRERLTGQAPPEAASKIVDLWRSHIEEKAGPNLDGLIGSIEDQRAFARSIAPLITPRHVGRDALRPGGRRERRRERRPGRRAEPSEGDSEEKSQGDRAEIETSEEPPTTSRRARRNRPTPPPANCPTRPRTPNRTRPPRAPARRRVRRTRRAAPNTRCSARNSTR